MQCVLQCSDQALASLCIHERDKAEVADAVLVIRCCLSTWRGGKAEFSFDAFSISVYARLSKFLNQCRTGNSIVIDRGYLHGIIPEMEF